MSDPLPVVALRQNLLAEGWTDDELRRLRRDGELRVLRPGAYLPDADAELGPRDRHILLIRAELPRLSPSVVVSHASAAALLGLPVPPASLRRVQVTRRRPNGGRRGSAVHLHVAPLDESEIIDIGGMAVTSVRRTIIDLGRSETFASAVVATDAALHARLVHGAALEDGLARCSGWPGAPAARRVVAFADGASESVGESRSRVAIHAAGLPAPRLQWEVRDAGRLLGRCDFGWPEHDVVGEFDGRVKYGRLLRPGQDPGEAVFREKLREDELRAHGLTVVRWIWSELDNFGPKATRLRSVLAATR